LIAFIIKQEASRGLRMLRLKIFGRFRAEDDLGNEIPIKSRKARALLAYLALPPGKPRSREELMALLWSDRGDEQARGSLRQVLSGLRRDLGDDPASALQMADDAITIDPEQVHVASILPGDKLLEGLHINDPAFEEWLRDERLQWEDKGGTESQPERLELPDIPSVAILPFVNMSGDPEQDYFAYGITENIITGLTRFRELFVIGMKSSVKARDGATHDGVTDLEQVGYGLGVAHIVEGSVRKAGNRIRVTAQLIEAVSGRRIWAEHYDRDLDDIFAVQDEITSVIVATLADRIEESGGQLALQKPTKDMMSYDYLLRGRQCLKRGTKEGEFEARRHLQRALELDPEYSTAYASLALSYMHEFESSWTDARLEALDHAFGFAEKAVTLDRTDSTAWMALAWAQFSKSQLELATTTIEIAISLNPNDYDNLCIKGWCLALSGDPRECVDCMSQAIRANPFVPVDCLNAIGIAEYTARSYEAAIEAFSKISGLALLKHACLAACYAQLGRTREARAASREALKLAKAELAAKPGEEVEELRAYLAAMFPFQDSANFEHLIDGLRKSGLPG
jgi:adenylate cyclase